MPVPPTSTVFVGGLILTMLASFYVASWVGRDLPAIRTYRNPMKYGLVDPKAGSWWPVTQDKGRHAYYMMGSCNSCSINALSDLNRFANLEPSTFLFEGASESDLEALRVKWPHIHIGTYDENFAEAMNVRFTPRVYLVDERGRIQNVQPHSMREEELYGFVRSSQ